jgi:hypothetical protein
MSKLSEVILKSGQLRTYLSEEERAILGLYGAAYKVVFERLNPDGCGTAEWPALCSTAEVLRKWAETQEPQLREVYERAIDDNVERALGRVENMRRAFRMNEVYPDLPKPPV